MVSVVIENAKLNRAPAIPTGVPITLGKEALDTLPLFKRIKPLSK